MPTPNSPTAETVDIHADPQFRDQFDAKAGDRALEKANVSDVVEPPRASARRCNVGRRDQQIRLLSGAAMVGAAAFAPIGRPWRIALAAIGTAEIITGAMRYCPLWHALDVDTNNVRALR